MALLWALPNMIDNMDLWVDLGVVSFYHDLGCTQIINLSVTVGVEMHRS